uniref:RNA-directed DNA polymerase, eukaryota n=1 Tax=Tanacetum cinerariifolium TaxID=118510 RepID=A0A6L2MV58_TANCI|nr:RNA-directed DNA polymerase, eukaryota [Tanacetum cinerariifolium]
MGSGVRGGYKLLNESLLEILLCNIFIMNFLVRLSTKKLWNTCAQYGMVQDVYILKKLFKQEQGSLNYGGDHVLMGCHNTPVMQAWAYDTFNRIASKWGELIYMDEFNASNKEDDIDQFEEDSDNNSVGIHNWEELNDDENSSNIFPEQLENSLIHVENYLVHVESSPEHMENFPDHIENSFVHVENSHVHVENSHDLSGDPFGNEVMENVAREGISSLGTIKSIPKNMSLGGSKHDYVDSLALSPKPINGFSILERFQEFICIGQAMGVGKWLAIDSELLFMSVYSPQDMPRKRQLWAYMTGITNHWHGDVVVMGDFNKARFTSEQHGFNFHASNAAEFSTFITNSHLIDVPLGGYSSTWSDKHASKMSKLDRFLVSEGLLYLFPNFSGLILHRHIFYYKLIILKESHMDYSPTPFRLFHSWFLEDSWNNDGVHASNAMILHKNKLKSLKQTLKTWSIQKKSIREHDRRVLQDYLLEIESRLDKGEGLSDNLPNLAKTSYDIGVIDHKIAVDLALKAKMENGLIIPIKLKNNSTTILRTDSLLVIGLVFLWKCRHRSHRSTIVGHRRTIVAPPTDYRRTTIRSPVGPPVNHQSMVVGLGQWSGQVTTLTTHRVPHGSGTNTPACGLLGLEPMTSWSQVQVQPPEPLC